MVLYKLYQRVNPKAPDATRKYYAFAKTSGTAEIRYIATRIARESTVSTVDTLAVLEALLDVIPDLLLEGKIVKLGEVGSFRLSLSSEGTENLDDFNVSMIKRTNLLFRAGSEFKNRLKNVKFTKVSDTSNP